MIRKNVPFTLLIISLWLMPADSWAQVDRYMVYFNDKPEQAYRLDKPAEFLSERALQRRKKHGISVTEEDLPVSAAYLNEVKATGAQVFYASRWLNAALIQASETTVAQVEGLPFVNRVEFVAPDEKLGIPVTDNSKVKSPGKFNDEVTAIQNAQLGIDMMHDDGLAGEGLRIAVLDGGFTGVDKSPLFEHLFNDEALLVDAFDFVHAQRDVFHTDDHGTRVLSILAADGLPIFRSVLPRAEYLLYVTEDAPPKYEHRIEEFNWLLAVERADSAGADIVHSSLGYNQFSDNAMDYSYQQLDGRTAVISRAANEAVERGMLIVTSAGNEGNKAWQYITAPADALDVISVGAVGQDGSKAAFSSVGPTSDGRIKPDLMAMGIYTAVVTGSGNISFSNGTSFSAPLITGLAGGVMQLHPGLTNKEIIHLLKQMGNQQVPNNSYGFGVPHFEKALLANEETPVTRTEIYPNPTDKNELMVQLSDAYRDQTSLSIYVYNNNGMVIDQLIFQLTQENQPLVIDISTLKPGLYIFSLQAAQIAEKVRVVKL